MKIEKDNQDRKERMVNILYKIDALKFGVFKLSTGKASPYYVDLKVIPSFPMLLGKSVNSILNILLHR